MKSSIECWQALDQCPEGPADGDVFLLCKQFMHSTSLSQKPVLLMPVSRLSRVHPAGPTQVVARNDLGDRTIREFRKTALAVSEAPWGMVRARAYLEHLCQENESQRLPCPPPLVFINTTAEELVQLIDQREQQGLPVELTDFAPGTPRRVVVTDAAPKDPPGRGRGRGHGRARGRARGRGRGRGRHSASDGAEGDNGEDGDGGGHGGGQGGRGDDQDDADGDHEDGDSGPPSPGMPGPAVPAHRAKRKRPPTPEPKFKFVELLC